MKSGGNWSCIAISPHSPTPIKCDIIVFMPNVWSAMYSSLNSRHIFFTPLYSHLRSSRPVPFFFNHVRNSRWRKKGRESPNAQRWLRPKVGQAALGQFRSGVRLTRSQSINVASAGLTASILHAWGFEQLTEWALYCMLCWNNIVLRLINTSLKLRGNVMRVQCYEGT